MLNVKLDGSGSAIVDYSSGCASVICDDCGLSKDNFPLKIAAPFNGSSFTLSTDTFGCPCHAVTVYPLRGTDPMSQILTKLSGF